MSHGTVDRAAGAAAILREELVSAVTRQQVSSNEPVSTTSEKPAAVSTNIKMAQQESEESQRCG